eukprot:1620641-Prymnesium_polylepis.1
MSAASAALPHAARASRKAVMGACTCPAQSDYPAARSHPSRLRRTSHVPPAPPLQAAPAARQCPPR